MTQTSWNQGYYSSLHPQPWLWMRQFYNQANSTLVGQRALLLFYRWWGELIDLSCHTNLTQARNGTVPYDFGVYDLPFKTDVCLVVLSVAKSTLKPLLEVVLKTGGSPTQKSNELAGEDLWEARLAIAQAALCQKAIKIPDEVKEFATKSFVEARKSDPLVTSDLFSTWMALARSSTLLDGEESLTVERWEKLMVLDGERRQRLQPLGQKKEPDQLPAAAG
eukprot:GHVN01056683.1.p2 GENE.GHVN01056683.1~~GHVN01056683.1.p2  ORF type:complete len:221 (+),score=33.66 GHVN01056683.1:373-1035(+)